MSDIVFLSTADWDNPFWTNKQYVAIELAKRGHRVIYVESLGLRRPTLSNRDISRISRRLKRGLKAPRLVRENLWVWSPLVLPFQKYSVVRAINRALLSAGICIWSKTLGVKPDVIWTYNPMTTQFMDVRGYRHSVYHCVDEVRAQPGMPVAEIEQSERKLMADVEFCFVTAQSLLDTRRKENPNTYYFSNVAEFDHFARARSEDLPPPLDIGPRTKPRVGFIGAISSYKVDFQLLCKMASMHRDWEIVLIGQVGEGDPSTNVSMLSDHANILLIGPRDYKDLPAYLKTFDVAILPCLINDYTRGMFPMKFFEYLAAGKPVVSTDLHALRSYADIAVIAESHEAFIRGVEDALTGDFPPLEHRLAAAKEQTYEIRTDKMLALIAETSGSEL